MRLFGVVLLLPVFFCCLNASSLASETRLGRLLRRNEIVHDESDVRIIQRSPKEGYLSFKVKVMLKEILNISQYSVVAPGDKKLLEEILMKEKQQLLRTAFALCPADNNTAPSATRAPTRPKRFISAVVTGVDSAFSLGWSAISLAWDYKQQVNIDQLRDQSAQLEASKVSHAEFQAALDKVADVSDTMKAQLQQASQAYARVVSGIRLQLLAEIARRERESTEASLSVLLRTGKLDTTMFEAKEIEKAIKSAYAQEEYSSTSYSTNYALFFDLAVSNCVSYSSDEHAIYLQIFFPKLVSERPKLKLHFVQHRGEFVARRGISKFLYFDLPAEVACGCESKSCECYPVDIGSCTELRHINQLYCPIDENGVIENLASYPVKALEAGVDWQFTRRVGKYVIMATTKEVIDGEEVPEHGVLVYQMSPDNSEWLLTEVPDPMMFIHIEDVPAFVHSKPSERIIVKSKNGGYAGLKQEGLWDWKVIGVMACIALPSLFSFMCVCYWFFTHDYSPKPIIIKS